MNSLIKYTIIVFAIAILLFVPESLVFQDGFSLCVLRNVTGMECPLCGMTRASYLLIRFHLRQAVEYNPLVLFLPFLLLLEVLNDVNTSTGIRKVRMLAWIAFVAGLVVLFTVRIVYYFV